MEDAASRNARRRLFGEHLTPIQVFEEFILPEIKDYFYDYIWVDLFAGEGSLILPILKYIPGDRRVEFFRKHIFLFDIQEEMVEKAVENAVKYGIPREVAAQNILQRDTLEDYPSFILNKGLPVYHITNPPYLYIGYIVKHKEAWRYLKYFKGVNEGYQDLYQIALMNDLRHGIKKMIYIIPSNFLYGYSVSNKIRRDFLKYYTIKKAVIFEKRIFEHTGTNVALCFFERKEKPGHEVLVFEGIKIDKTARRRVYTLDPKYYYRAGYEFEAFVNEFQAVLPLKVEFYLTIEEVEENKGGLKVEVIDANSFNGREYRRMKIHVNNRLYRKIKSNILFARTLDTGDPAGRAGLYVVREVFGVDGILVTKAKYRTHPIQVFIEPQLTVEEQLLLKDYFNLVLEYFREKTDSEFMTTYKYSDSEYTRKYLGLTQVKKLIQTFPWLKLSSIEREYFRELVRSRNTEKLVEFVKEKNSRKPRPHFS